MGKGISPQRSWEEGGEEGRGPLEARPSGKKDGVRDAPSKSRQTDSKLSRGQNKDNCDAHHHLWVTPPPSNTNLSSKAEAGGRSTYPGLAPGSVLG